jgi:hypothetical protein
MSAVVNLSFDGLADLREAAMPSALREALQIRESIKKLARPHASLELDGSAMSQALKLSRRLIANNDDYTSASTRALSLAKSVARDCVPACVQVEEHARKLVYPDSAVLKALDVELRAAIAFARNADPRIRYATSRNPRRATPAAGLLTLMGYLEDEEPRTRESIERRVHELETAYDAGLHLTVLMHAGGLLEAVLRCILRAKGQTNLADLLDHATSGKFGAPLLSESSSLFGSAVRAHRNLIHPDKEARSTLRVDEGTARLILDHLRYILHELDVAWRNGIVHHVRSRRLPS